MRRGRHPGHAPVLACQDVFDFARRDFSLPNLHQRARDAPAHLVKKAISLDDERHQRAAPFDVATAPPCAPWIPPRNCGVAAKDLKSCVPGKILRRRAHRRQIQRTRHLPGLPAQQRVHRRVVPDKITILFACRVEPRVKIFRRATRADTTRTSSGSQALSASASFAPVILTFRARHLHMRHHAQRMHARVRAARTVDSRPRRETVSPAPPRPVAGRPCRFSAPASPVGRAVVGDGQLEFRVWVRSRQAVQITLQQNRRRRLVHLFLALVPAHVRPGSETGWPAPTSAARPRF